MPIVRRDFFASILRVIGLRYRCSFGCSRGRQGIAGRFSQSSFAGQHQVTPTWIDLRGGILDLRTLIPVLQFAGHRGYRCLPASIHFDRPENRMSALKLDTLGTILIGSPRSSRNSEPTTSRLYLLQN